MTYVILLFIKIVYSKYSQVHFIYKNNQIFVNVILFNVLPRVMYVSIDGGFDWILDLLTTYTHDSELPEITAPSLISAIHKSSQYPLSISSLLCLHEPFPGNGW
jgi:hypothetical protein